MERRSRTHLLVVGKEERENTRDGSERGNKTATRALENEKERGEVVNIWLNARIQ